MGIPTRYGNFPTQFKAFWDHTGGQWQNGSYYGKYCGVFVSTATPGGGQESTVMASMSTLAHHGIIYVPVGYKHAFPILSNLTEVRGGSPWGAGTFAVSFSNLRIPDPVADQVLFPHPRLAMAAVSPQKWSSSSPRSKAKLSMRPWPRLISHD